MIHPRLIRPKFVIGLSLSFSILLVSLAGCNLPDWQNIPAIMSATEAQPGVDPALKATDPAAALPSPAETLITFQAQPPGGSSSDEAVFLTILDEVTGLAFNTQPIPMQIKEETGEADSAPVYEIMLPFPIGTVVKYRYERQAEGLRVSEHLSDGSAVRYRLYHVVGQGSVLDVISRWTDTPFDQSTGRIQGNATDAESGQPIPNLLVSVSGAQTLTAADGSFMLEGLPPGVHNLVGYAMDGAYQTFQQGARVAEGSTTPTPIQLKAAPFSNVVFVVKPPAGTPPIVPLRLAGNLSQLGNTFATLSGGMSSLAANMPALSALPDGRYTITIALPAGADIRYKYTLGDGFWNAEHQNNGAFRLRQLIVPDRTVLVEDTVESWFAGPQNEITFSVDVPADTPPGDFISIQYNPLFGWTEPIPMWKLGETRWAYVLYSPLNLPGDFSYRYCRNNQCGIADDAQTPGQTGAGRKVGITSEPQTISDQVKAWADWSNGASAVLPPLENVIGRGDGYWTGVELSPRYQPSWDKLLPTAFSQIQSGGSNRVILTPTWTYGRSAPGNELPILAPLPGRDASWNATMQMIEQAKSVGLKVGIHPIANFSIPVDQWWLEANRDESWWQVWFEQYRGFVLHHADMAAASGAESLILGGDWLRPTLPGQKLPDGSENDHPEDVENRWRELLGEARSRFSGQLVWTLSHQDVTLPPPFLDLVDKVYMEISIPAGQSIETTVGQGLDNWLDVPVMAFQFQTGKPFLLAVACPSDPDLQTQVDCYQTFLMAANQRDWISGFISLGYFPPAALRDRSTSVHGKPAAELLELWYPQMVK